MLGTIVNSLAVVAGSIIGLLFGKLFTKKLGDAVMTGLALVVIYIGISGAFKGENTLVAIISISIGAIIGTLLDLDGKILWLGDRVESLVSKSGDGSVAKGFVSASLLFCVGAMTVVGSLDSGLRGDHSTLFTKAMLDGISAIFFASSLGIGVIFSAVFILVYQGAITLAAQFIEPYINYGNVIGEMTCVGSLLILALGLNMLKITNIKVMNYLPAIFLPIIVCKFF